VTLVHENDDTPNTLFLFLYVQTHRKFAMFMYIT
jgi:hypothetical protein